MASQFLATVVNLGDEESPSLEKFTEHYKNSKGLNTKLPLVNDLNIVMEWIKSIEVTEPSDNEITEADILKGETASMTSTNYYGQEPFRKYQPKLFKLLAGIVPRDVSLNSVGRMKGGGNNRTASIGLDWPAGKRLKVNSKLIFEPRNEDFEVRAVFRASRWPSPGKDDPDIMDNYAILTLLGACNVKVPTVFAYDSTPFNSVGVPYMLLSRVPGFRLEDIYQSLTQKQKERVAHLVAEQILAFEGIESEMVGVLKGVEHCIPTKLSFAEERPSTFEIEVTHFVTGIRRKLPVKVSRSPYTLMKRMMINWIRISREGSNTIKPEILEVYEYCFGQLAEVLEVMNARGYFDERCRDKVGLHHPDLYARNIIIGASCRRPDNISFQIEGIIDWDDAMSLPEVLRSSPCAWLWELNGPQVSKAPAWEEWYGDSDELPAGRFEYRLSPDERKIKERFDETMGAEKVKIMYKVEYVWIRRLWKFAYHGLYLGSDDGLKRLERFMERWGQYAQNTNHLFDDFKAKHWKSLNPELIALVREFNKKDVEMTQ
ncbi:hypothetical protein ABW20_dc0104679 [Dactylellina cionopaga]|nr:hypothetical protein ABW20_dc0104679 [Dactylellina cionopaga]